MTKYRIPVNYNIYILHNHPTNLIDPFSIHDFKIYPIFFGQLNSINTKTTYKISIITNLNHTNTIS